MTNTVKRKKTNILPRDQMLDRVEGTAQRLASAKYYLYIYDLNAYGTGKFWIQAYDNLNQLYHDKIKEETHNRQCLMLKNLTVQFDIKEL